jgi:hypothetical protein
MRPVVVDANVFKHFFEEQVNESPAEATSFMDAVLTWGHIAWDEKKFVAHEWRETSCGLNTSYFDSWVQARIIENKIQMYEDVTTAHLKKRARQGLGIPSRDLKYICLAISANSIVIFSNDIDMFEPKAKAWPEAKKTQIKTESSGCVCVWLRNDHGINVHQVAQAPAFFSDHP